MATYNGERHLAAQLESLRDQTRLPVELVIVDDASTDGTLGVAERFARNAPFPVRILSRPYNRGSTAAFAEAIASCAGDVIALVDQDDVWSPCKLESMIGELDRRPDAAFAFSDAEVVDECLRPLGYRLWDAIRFGPSERRRFLEGFAFEALLRRHRVTGATMAFRAKLRDRILPIPEGWVHDAWIALILSATSPCVPIGAPLMRYRQHANQQHGGRRRGWLAEFHAARGLTRDECEAVATRFECAWERLTRLGGVSESRLNRLRQKIEHHRERAAMRAPGTWRWPRVCREALNGRYSRFGLGWKAAAQDWLLG